jgi:transmembrane sensor
MNKHKYTESDLEKIAGRFGQINTDSAWDKVRSRIGGEEIFSEAPHSGKKSNRFIYLRIAAAVVLIIGLGAGFFYIRNSTIIGNRMVVASGADERNVEVTLPDGSKAWLNRNSKLTYSKNPGIKIRNVKLTGEAFFEISPDASRPFTIDAGKANVTVIGTSFNVITSNRDNEVEVFVKTGKVLLSDPSGTHNIMLEPGSVGTLSESGLKSSYNENRNYMAWKTDTLVYQGEKLENVFADLKRVFNINISADDPEINNNSLTTTFFSLPEDTIIQVICSSFNLRYQKDGSVYYLTK